MKTALLSVTLAAALLSTGCPVPIASDEDAGAGAVYTSDGGIPTVAATGSGCDTTSANGTPLCQAISLCPTLVVDPSVYPDCGFRISGSAIDLECECSGYLCAIGTAESCTDAATLLAQQNSSEVCSHSYEGACIQETATATASDGGTSTTTTGPASTCDMTCESTCVSDPNCIQACGC
jgi:hypothetical protein